MIGSRGLVAILFACSGVMRAAFEAHGWEAIEVDAQAPEVPGAHWQGDVFEFLRTPEFRRAALVILHPPCTYLASAGLHWNASVPGREMCSRWALHQTRRLFAELRGRRFVLENPAGLIGSRIRPATQSVQPYYFGDDASKLTCLWMGGLPRLEIPPPRLWHPGRLAEWPPGSGRLTRRWSNQDASGQNTHPDSFARAVNRSRTYPGIAAAIAAQATDAIEWELPLERSFAG